MQTWHCVVLILLSIGIYLYATFVQDYQKETKIGLALATQNDSPNDGKLIDANHSDNNLSLMEKPHWAEFILALDLTGQVSHGLHYHELALKSDRFLSTILASLDNQPLAKSEILNPFVSGLMNQPHKEIISYLITVEPSSSQSLSIKCKGFSIKTARLLAELILREYPKALAFEKADQPVLPILQQILQEIATKEEEANELKVMVQEKFGESPTDSIETMVLKAQISELDDEIKECKSALLKIDKIHKENLPPEKYLQIETIRNFGKTEELHNILEKLKKMKLDKSLSSIVQKEIQNNILSTSKSLEEEIVSSISSLKQKVTDLLNKKRKVQEQVADLITAHRTGLSESPALAKLKLVKKELSSLNETFKNESLAWATCKKNYSLRKSQ